MKFLIDPTSLDSLYKEFTITIQGVPGRLLNELQAVTNKVLFGIEAPKPETPGFYTIDLKTMEETALLIYRRGDKIASIKFVRQCTNWDLKRSKEWIEDLNTRTAPGFNPPAIHRAI